ncbi:MAG: hypothetical protein ACRDL4_14065 [Thermoleophilaceae bacterium]
MIEGWVFDSDAMRAYATVRHFLSTLRWREFTDLDEAAQELFVVDLDEQPRGLLRFSALYTRAG